MREKFRQLMELYQELKQEVRLKDRHLYEQWKAGGFLIDNDIISMYPNLEKVLDIIGDEEEECEHPNAVLSDDEEPATYHCPDCGEDFID